MVGVCTGECVEWWVCAVVGVWSVGVCTGECVQWWVMCSGGCQHTSKSGVVGVYTKKNVYTGGSPPSGGCVHWWVQATGECVQWSMCAVVAKQPLNGYVNW